MGNSNRSKVPPLLILELDGIFLSSESSSGSLLKIKKPFSSIRPTASQSAHTSFLYETWRSEHPIRLLDQHHMGCYRLENLQTTFRCRLCTLIFLESRQLQIQTKFRNLPRTSLLETPYEGLEEIQTLQQNQHTHDRYRCFA